MKEHDPVVILMDTFPDLTSVQLRALSFRETQRGRLTPRGAACWHVHFDPSLGQWLWQALHCWAVVMTCNFCFIPGSPREPACSAVCSSKCTVGQVLSMHFQLTIPSASSLCRDLQTPSPSQWGMWMLLRVIVLAFILESLCVIQGCLFPHQLPARFSLHSCLL